MWFVGYTPIQYPLGGSISPFEWQHIPDTPFQTMHRVVTGLAQKHQIGHFAIVLILIYVMDCPYHVA